mmetsp:Transcript_19920/g.63332  ORF Transcript_19920/g.63332 Transcript_19920/m.63332 type:complete len:205 (-) Transcript_19920:3163-3777(-)
MMVARRWAIVMTVHWAKRVRTICWMRWSVSWSTDAVASSSSKMEQSCTIARARQMSCRCPTDRFVPSSSTLRSSAARATASSPSPASGAAVKTASRSPNATAFTASSSVDSGKALVGSRFVRTVPAKRTGSCGITAIALLSVRSPSVAVSTPPMRTEPLVRPTSRSRHANVDDLPLPVAPTRPTFSPGRATNDTPLSAGGSDGR